METFVEKIFSAVNIIVFLTIAFGLMIVVGRISNLLIRKIFGIGGN